MKGFQFIVEGNWAHFKKPETNNNPLSHDLITKTALIGLIGAVLGIERTEMKAKFPELSDNLLYNVELCSSVKKVSWGFTSRKANYPTSTLLKHRSPRYFEFLKNPKYKISLALKNKASENIFSSFIQSVKNEETIYPPVLGWHNCPANISFFSEGEFSELKTGKFETKGFILAGGEHKPTNINGEFRVGFDKLPTYQDDDFWNLPDKYNQIIYPDFPHSLQVEGEYYEYKTNSNIEKWWLM